MRRGALTLATSATLAATGCGAQLPSDRHDEQMQVLRSIERIEGEQRDLLRHIRGRRR